MPTITAPAGLWLEQVIVTVEMGYAGPLTNVVQVTVEEGATGTFTRTVLVEGDASLSRVQRAYERGKPMTEKVTTLRQEYMPDRPDDEAPLPEFLRSLFWEVDFDRLCVQGHERYVIERVLEYGDLPEVKWMLGRFTREEIVQTLRRSRGLSPKSANFWAFILGVPSEEIRCLSTSFRQRPGKIWLR